MRRRRGISGGTVAMLLLTVLVLTATFFVMYTIRQDEGDLSMDAEQLLASVNELIALSQHHLTDEQPPEATVIAAVQVTPVPVLTSTEAPTRSASETVATQNAPSPTVTPNASRALTLTIGGAITLESSIIDGAFNKTEQHYDFHEIFSGISNAVHADLNLAVLESVFTTDESKENDMVAPAGSVEALTAGGFDGVVLCAENALAGGRRAVQETLSTLQARGLLASGLRMPDDAERMTMLQINGIQLAILSYTESLSAESKRGIPDPLQQAAMLNLFQKEQAITDITQARQRGANAVIVFLHWGTKAATEPSQAQQLIAQALCDAGADVIIGTKSRAVQNVEWIRSTDNTRNTLVAWSLGTLLCEDRDTREVVSGALLHLRLAYDPVQNDVIISHVEYSPTYAWRQEEKGVNKYRVLLSAQPAPEGMIQRQREIMGRSLALIQTTFAGGAAIQR